MELDRDRLAETLRADYGFYYQNSGSTPSSEVIDERLKPDTQAYIGSQLAPGMRVLDVGCGNGSTLLVHSGAFAYGLGVDHDPEHLEMAVAARDGAAGAEQPVTNVEFRQLDIRPGMPEIAGLETPDGEPYDMIFTERGPFGRDEQTIRALLRYLRPGGVIFAEMIGERHHQEMRELFGPRNHRSGSALEQGRVAMERAGVEVRMTADFLSKRTYVDVYDWLRFQCHIWAWGGQPFPDPDDPRIALFAERNSRPETVNSGDRRIVTTHHVTWVGGIVTNAGH